MKEKFTARKLWDIIYPYLIFYGINYLTTTLLTIVISSFIVKNGEYSFSNMTRLTDILNNLISSQSMLITLIVDGAAIPIFFALRNRDIIIETTKGIYKKFQKVTVGKYLLIIPFALFGMYGANALVSLLSMFMPTAMLQSYDTVKNIIYQSNFVVEVLAAGIVGPIAEELLHRGLLYNRIKRMTSITMAAVLSSILFGIFHGNWVQAPYAFIIGMLCVYVYEKYKSIAAPIIFHISANMFSIILTEIVSKYTYSSQTIVNTMSNTEIALSYLSTIMYTTIFTVILGLIINKLVKPKEIN